MCYSQANVLYITNTAEQKSHFGRLGFKSILKLRLDAGPAVYEVNVSTWIWGMWS